MIESLPALSDRDPWFARRGRHINVDFLVGVGDESWILRIREGRVERADRVTPVARSWDFAIRAGAEAWAQFWQPTPPPQRNDIMALVKHGMMTIEGNLHPLFANLLWFKALLALPRGQGGAT